MDLNFLVREPARCFFNDSDEINGHGPLSRGIRGRSRKIIEMGGLVGESAGKNTKRLGNQDRHSFALGVPGFPAGPDYHLDVGVWV